MKKTIFAILLTLFVAACQSVGRLDQGIIELGQRQSHFIRAWGLPDRQYTQSGQDLMQASINRTGGSFFKGRYQYEVWVYKSRKTELVFDQKRRLAGYHTEMSREELERSYIGQPQSQQ